MKKCDFGKVADRMKIAVWYDDARALICILDTQDPKYQALPDGADIPGECIFTLKVGDTAEFMGALLTMVSLRESLDMGKLIAGVLGVADREAARWGSFAQNLRDDIRRRSGGTPTACLEKISIPVDEYTRLKRLDMLASENNHE